MKNKIIIISHRRSGTHLTIDTIKNNFSVYKKNQFFTLNEKSIDKLDSINSSENLIIKTHFLPSFDIYSENTENIKYLFQNSYLIYVYRNGLDVMVSLYEYLKAYDTNIQKINFHSFLKTFNNFDNTKIKYTRPEFWQFHIKSWQNSSYAKNILWLKYEEFINNYSQTIKKISEAIETNHNQKITDIRLNSSKIKQKKLKKLVNTFKGIKTTSVSARKGIIGDWKNYFDIDDIKYFLDINYDFLKQIGY